MSRTGIQLEMSFDMQRNRVQERLESGTFSVFVEVPSPRQSQDLERETDRVAEIEYTVNCIDYLPVGLAFTEKLRSPEPVWGSVDFAANLCQTNKDMHLVYISGRGATLAEIQEMVGVCATSGFANIIPVSGESYPEETRKDVRKETFTESVHVLHWLKENSLNSFNQGCTFNPFKYTADDHFTQYFKLIMKLNQGANFIVTQLGWDMLKLQELRWYLTSRGMHYPSIARLMLLTPEKVMQILDGDWPGIRLSPDFATMLEREVRFSHRQFESAQWRRIQLQAAGCKLLGYSGIQLSGLNNVEQIRIACRRIAEALDEFTTFEDWRTAYREHLARAEMAPYPNRFYMFDKLFEQAHLDGTPKMNEASLSSSTRGERLHYKLCKFFFSHASRQDPDEHLLTKKILTGCRRCTYCRLPLMHYVCPETCPKGLANGPCGGTQADGTCELGQVECIHSKRIRLATWLNEIDGLEERYIRCAEPL